MRFFNTAGPVNPARHYCLDPLRRLDLGTVLPLIEQEKYFVLHAPPPDRQDQLPAGAGSVSKRRWALSLLLRQFGDRSGGARRRGGGDAGATE